MKKIKSMFKILILIFIFISNIIIYNSVRTNKILQNFTKFRLEFRISKARKDTKTLEVNLKKNYFKYNPSCSIYT